MAAQRCRIHPESLRHNGRCQGCQRKARREYNHRATAALRLVREHGLAV